MFNYNNPYTPYNNYGYGNYGNQQFQPQSNYVPLAFISGIEGARAHIVTPNSTVFLKDVAANTLYEKSADAQGNYTMRVYKPVDLSPDTQQMSNKVLSDIYTKIDKLYEMFDKHFIKEEGVSDDAK